MAFKIADHARREPVTEFWLEEDDGDISLVARRVGEQDSWYVLSINDDGRLCRHPGVDEEVNLTVDRDGLIAFADMDPVAKVLKKSAVDEVFDDSKRSDESETTEHGALSA